MRGGDKFLCGKVGHFRSKILTLDSDSLQREELRKVLMADLFISYRRGLDRHAAGRLYGELVKIFGSRRIFMDVDNIPAGDDFEKRLERSVARCNVLLAVIGLGWASVRDNRGRLRLFQSDDFVRIEISSALERGVTVVPVLIDGADMPSKQELPAELHGLTRCHAVWLRHDRFRRM